MSEPSFREQLSIYIPQHSVDLIYNWIKPFRLRIKITKPRNSKLGDFRVKDKRHPYQISVNGNLNPYSFLITLTHEIAHMIDFEQRGHLRDAHGKNWKSIYADLLKQLVEVESFPKDLIPAISYHINNPKAASCSDPKLLNALRDFDEKPTLRLKDLPHGSAFSLNTGRAFIVGELKRTRYKCQEITSKRWFLIHGEAEVMHLTDAEFLT
ncbi:MAG: sprT domain-containing protein [Salibacteraceae bacterium]